MDPYKDYILLELNESIKKVDMHVVDYDSIFIKSEDNFILSDKEIDTISISFDLNNDSYSDFNSIIIPDYEGKSEKYRIDFKKV